MTRFPARQAVAFLSTAAILLFATAVMAEKDCGCARPAAGRGYPPGGQAARSPESAADAARRSADQEKKTRLARSLMSGGGEIDLKEAQLIQSDSGTARTVTLGYPIYVRLSHTPSSGREWKLVDVKGTSVREEGKPVFYPRERETGGAGGAMVFKFKAVAIGRTWIKLVYQGSKDKRPINLFTCTLLIKADSSSASPEAKPAAAAAAGRYASPAKTTRSATASRHAAN